MEQVKIVSWNFEAIIYDVLSPTKWLTKADIEKIIQNKGIPIYRNITSSTLIRMLYHKRIIKCETDAIQPHYRRA